VASRKGAKTVCVFLEAEKRGQEGEGKSTMLSEYDTV